MQMMGCPFCGNKDVEPVLCGFSVAGYVKCKGCGALVFFPWNKCETMRDLVAQWNRRMDADGV